MADDLAKLTQTGVDIGYRSSQDPRHSDRVLKYDRVLQIVTTDINGSDAPPQRFELEKMDRVNTKDYPEVPTLQWAILLCEKTGKQHCFIFKRHEDRDALFTEIRSVLRTLQNQHDQVKQQQTHAEARQITAINFNEKEPMRPGKILKLEITFDRPFPDAQGKDKTTAELLIDDYDMSNTKEKYNDLLKESIKNAVREHNIASIEGPSLYRLVKAAVTRKKVRDEAEAIKNEIEDLHFDKHAEGHTLSPSTPLQANEALDDLKREIPKRLGSAGVGIQLVTKILERNVEKMKAINELTSKYRLSQMEERRGTPAGSSRSTPRT